MFQRQVQLVLLLSVSILMYGCRQTEVEHVIVVEKPAESKDESSGSKGEGVKSAPEDDIEGKGVKPVPDSDQRNDAPAMPSDEDSDEQGFVREGNSSVSDTDANLNYQLGDTWSRNTTQAFHENHRTILRGTVATDTGLISSNFTVLKILSNDEVLLLAAVHAFARCTEEGVLLRSKEMMFHGQCSGIYSVVPETDSVIFSLKFFDESVVENLVPVSFAPFVEQGDRLKFYTIGHGEIIPGYFPLYLDSDIDCLMISSDEKQIFDPDPVQPVLGALYWSLAVSCDVKHGDSGGILVNRDNELVGMIWTGAFPKSPLFTTKALMSLARGSETDLFPMIWTGLNYAVPSYRIESHLNSILETREQLKGQ